MFKVILFSVMLLSAIPGKVESDFSRYHEIDCLMITGDIEKHVFEYDIDDKPENVCREINGQEI